MQHRLLSLDCFRGFIIIAMVVVNMAEDTSFLHLPHALWHGWTFADTIFPAFLWIVGIALVFSLTKRLAKGVSKNRIALQILRRSCILFVLGILLYNFPHYDISTIRVLGVLQRIAICYFLGSMLFLFSNVWGQVFSALLLLFGYWVLLAIASVPGVGSGVLEQNGNIVQYVDVLLLKGHLWSNSFDPEGIVSTIGALTTLLFGVLTGQFLHTFRNNMQKAYMLFGVGIMLIITGQIMNMWLPINKNLWTSSYVVLMAGFAMLAFSVLYFLVEVKEYKVLAKPFIIFGINPITIYIVSILLSKSLMLIRWQNRAVLDILLGSMNQFVFVCLYVLFLYAIAYSMYNRQWIIKI